MDEYEYKENIIERWRLFVVSRLRAGDWFPGDCGHPAEDEEAYASAWGEVTDYVEQGDDVDDTGAAGRRTVP